MAQLLVKKLCVYVSIILVVEGIQGKKQKNIDDLFLSSGGISYKKKSKKVNDLNIYYPNNLVAYFKISGHLMQAD